MKGTSVGAKAFLTVVGALLLIATFVITASARRHSGSFRQERLDANGNDTLEAAEIVPSGNE